MTELAVRPPLLREVLGECLRAARVAQGRTLREVSADARVSLGYLSELERGQKEASSELLAAVCAALDVPLAEILARVTEQFASGTNLTVLRPRGEAVAAA